MNTRPEIGNKRSLELYLEEIKDYQPLDSKEEILLARLAKKGDLKAINKLITHNLRFVVAVAKKFQGQGIPFEDLINEGNLGLIKAVDKFDETRGFRFISYAVWWITQGIRQAIQKTGRVIRLPAHVRESMGKLYKKSIELEKDMEREPTSEELAEITKKSPEWVNDYFTNSDLVDVGFIDVWCGWEFDFEKKEFIFFIFDCFLRCGPGVRGQDLGFCRFSSSRNFVTDPIVFVYIQE